jgi:tetratricopeptide (TPR) repeat protein
MRAGNDGARRAEFLVDTHDPASAIAEYGRQWERDKSQPLPLYLKGLALRSAGREEEAKQAIETAHLLPLGRIWERQQLWKDLLDRGFPDEAARQREVMMKVDRGSGPVDDAIRPTAIDAWKHGDPRKGADLFDQSLPGLSQGEFVLARLHFYLDVANDRHRMKADVLLSNGDVDGAMKELRTCQSLMPVSTMPIEVAAKLEAAGHRAEADELIAGTVAVQEANIGLYPDTPQFHNELAWLFSKTHRRLDDALAHSKKAVSLQPKFYDYYDTLADVHFHRDERQEAIETIQHALSLAREVHRDDLVAAGEKRLKHFEEDAIPTGAEKFD